MKFKRYIKEGLLPEKVTGQITRALIKDSGLGDAISEVIKEAKKTRDIDLKAWRTQDPSMVRLDTLQVQQRIKKKYKDKWRTVQISKYVRDKAWKEKLKESSFTWTFRSDAQGGGAYVPKGKAGRFPDDNSIYYFFPLQFILAFVGNEYPDDGQWELIKTELERHYMTVEHEVSHLMRDMEYGQLTKIQHAGKSDKWEGYREKPLETYWEIDAYVHGMRALKRKLGQKKWDSMEFNDIEKYAPDMFGYVNASPKSKKEFLKRMAREGLLGKNMVATLGPIRRK